jgi:hypothetical protein
MRTKFRGLCDTRCDEEMEDEAGWKLGCLDIDIFAHTCTIDSSRAHLHGVNVVLRIISAAKPQDQVRWGRTIFHT